MKELYKERGRKEKREKVNRGEWLVKTINIVDVLPDCGSG